MMQLDDIIDVSRDGVWVQAPELAALRLVERDDPEPTAADYDRQLKLMRHLAAQAQRELARVTYRLKLERERLEQTAGEGYAARAELKRVRCATRALEYQIRASKPLTDEMLDTLKREFVTHYRKITTGALGEHFVEYRVVHRASGRERSFDLRGSDVAALRAECAIGCVRLMLGMQRMQIEVDSRRCSEADHYEI